MTGPRNSLRDELHRIGDRAPVAEVSADTWRRARRARRRDGLLVLASAAAAVALVFGVIGALPTRQDPPIATGDGGAVPSHIWAVPERMAAQDNNEQWMRDEVESDLAIGRAAAAYVMTEGLPVVIGAFDGSYHLLDLPGFNGRLMLMRSAAGSSASLSLSPDGRQLAYSWSGPSPASDATPMPSGIRVVDLTSGRVRSVRLEGGRGVLVDTVVWSPDSRWLAWKGETTKYWTGSSYTSDGPAAGRIAPGAAVSESLPPTRDASTAMAVSDTGLVAVLDTNHLVRWDGRVLGRTRVHTGELNPGGAFDPSGSSFAYGRWHAARAATSMGVAEGAVTAHRLPPDVYPDGADVRPLGWMDDDLMVLQVTPLDAEGQDTGGHQVVVTTREVSSTSTYRIVAHTDGGVPDNLSVAVDLMTLERPTVDRPEPDWPWSEERWVAVIGLGLGGTLVLLLMLRRTLRPRPL